MKIKMKSIVIIGCGSRECAVLMKLLQTPDIKYYNIYTIATILNPYMVNNSTILLVKSLTLENIKKLDIFSINKAPLIDFVFIGPEQPLVEGIVDYLHARNIFCIAPSKSLARIESSKIYARKLIQSSNLLYKYNPKFKLIKQGTNKNDLIDELDNCSFKRVIKKNGLCGGKGVYVEDDHFSHINDLVNGIILIEDLNKYIKHDNILVEEKLEGLEFSLMSLVDKNGNIKHFDPIFDYKRLKENDLGPNTGSMGCVLLNNNLVHRFVPKQFIIEAQKVNEETIKLLNNDNEDSYKGILYGSFMLCKNEELKIIEFNVRLGDPEGVLSLFSFSNSLTELFLAVKYGTLDILEVILHNENMIGVYIVPNNYPISKDEDMYNIYFRGKIKEMSNSLIDGSKNIFNNNLSLVFGSCEVMNKHIYTKNSRSMLFVAKDMFLYKAYKNLYSNIDDIVGNIKYRKDIGSKFLTSYEKSGISIDNSNTLVSKIKNLVVSTYNNNVLGDHGDFGGSYKLQDNELVSSIDGVGTKTHFVDNYFKNINYESLGVDIVNHNINDILVMGAEPLFFLDYYGCATLNKLQFMYFIKGVSEALTVNGRIPLIGGETAEMPTTYRQNSTDIVGCIIGKKNTDFISFPRKPKSKDILVGLLSDGPHTNGFSLINSHDWKQELKTQNISKKNYIDFLEKLKTPHKSYLTLIRYFVQLYGNKSIIRMCHNTGGGLVENLKRVIPKNINIILDYNKLDEIYPKWCKTIEKYTHTSKQEMYRVFNCGIGFVLVLDEKVYEKVSLEKRIQIVKIGNLHS